MIIASGFSKCIISLIVLLWHFKNVWLRACVCVAFISKGIHFPMGRRVYLFLMPLLLWIGTDRLWQSCCARSRCICSEILLLLFLLSCLFPLISHLSRSPHLSAPSLPLSPTRRADCVWGPQAEESSPGAGPHWEDPVPAWTCGAAARTHAAPGERWVNAHLHEPPHTSPPSSLVFWPYFHLLFISSGPASFPLTADVFEDDISSSSSPTEQHSTHQSPAFSSLPRLSGDQLLSDCSALVPTLNHGPCHAQVREWH